MSRGDSAYSKPEGFFIDQEQDSNVSAVQKLITWLLVRGIADHFLAIIRALFGNVTLDAILFNRYSGTKLAFYKENGKGTEDGNDFIDKVDDATGISVLKIVSDFYSVFVGISIILFIGLFNFLAIMIIFKSTGKEREKYKSMLMDWFVGLLMLFFFPYFIKYSIILNEALVGLVEEVKINNSEFKEKLEGVSPKVESVSDALYDVMDGKKKINNTDLMMLYRDKALETGNLVYGMIYIFLLKELLGLLFMYYKRVIMVLFLIIMFPFVSVTYALDKIKDGKAQIYQTWLKEFLINVFMQFFQALVYIAVMFIITGLMAGEEGSGRINTVNILLTLIAIRYIAKSESLLRVLFPTVMSNSPAGTVKPLSAAVQQMTNIKLLTDAGKIAKGMGGKITNAKNKALEFRNAAYEARAAANIEDEKRRAEEADRRELSKIDLAKSLSYAQAALPTASIGANARQNALEKRMKALDDLALARSKDRASYDAKMATLSDSQREEIEQQMDAKEQINEVLTGQDRSGRKLSDQEINIRAKTVVDIIRENGGNPTRDRSYKELHEWMESKTWTARETIYQDQYGGHLTVAEGKKRAAGGGVVRKTVVDREVRLSDYLDIEHSSEVLQDVRGKNTSMRKGAGLAGRYVSDADSKKMTKASSFIGGIDGVKKTKSEDLDTTFDTTTKKTRLVDEQALRLDDLTGVTTDKSMIISIDEEELDRVTELHSSDIESIVSTYGSKGASDISDGQVRDAAKLLFELQEYTQRLQALNPDPTLPPQGRVEVSEAYRIASSLNQLASQNAFVNALVNDAVNSAETPRGTPTAANGANLDIDLGFSLELLETMAAQGIVHANGNTTLLKADDRKKYTAQAIASLNHESEDDAVLAVQRRSENDDILGVAAIRKPNDNGKIYRKEGQTQEELLEETFEEELMAERERFAANNLRAARRKAFSKGVEAAGAAVGATVGVTLETVSGVTLSSLTFGASSNPQLSGVLGSFNTGASLENFTERIVPGTVTSKGHLGETIAKGLKGEGHMTEEEKENLGRTGSTYDITDPVVIRSVQVSKAKARTQELKDRLHNA